MRDDTYGIFHTASHASDMRTYFFVLQLGKMVVIVMKIRRRMDTNPNTPLFCCLLYFIMERRQPRMYRYVTNNNSRRLRRILLDRPELVHARWERLDYTSLHIASLNGAHRVARVLIEHGADVNAEDTTERTPLHYACRLEDDRIAEMLLDAGANIDAADSNGRTPLIIASMGRSRIHVLELLIERHAEANVFDNNGLAAIHYAAERGSTISLELLHHAGVDLLNTRQMEDGFTLAHIAAVFGRFDVLMLLTQLDGFDVDVRTSDGVTPLHFACSYSHDMLVRFLAYDMEADVHAVTTETNDTPLHILCHRGNSTLAEEFIDRYDLDVEQRCRDSHKPIHLAAYENHLHVVEMLHGRGARISGVLERAAFRGSRQIVQYALQQGAANNVERLRHAFRLAGEQSHVDIAFLLLRMHHVELL